MELSKKNTLLAAASIAVVAWFFAMLGAQKQTSINLDICLFLFKLTFIFLGVAISLKE